MNEDGKLSTTRLAELLHVDSKQLFRLLSDKGWITRIDNHWRLTAHGEVEGGSYQHSEKYGEYIVWPAGLVDHPLLATLDDATLTATRIGDIYSVSAQRINSLFSELGWIDRDQRGWMLTERGKTLGGEQRTSDKGFFVVWPGTIRHHDEFVSAMETLQGKGTGPSLDGHPVQSVAERQIDNWLYLHGLIHAYRRPLPGSDLCCAFYLPQRKVYIDFWGMDLSSGKLGEKLEKEQHCASHGLKVITLHDEDLPRLDDVLPQKLLQFGIQLHSQ